MTAADREVLMSASARARKLRAQMGAVGEIGERNQIGVLAHQSIRAAGILEQVEHTLAKALEAKS